MYIFSVYVSGGTFYSNNLLTSRVANGNTLFMDTTVLKAQFMLGLLKANLWDLITGLLRIK